MKDIGMMMGAITFPSMADEYGCSRAACNTRACPLDKIEHSCMHVPSLNWVHLSSPQHHALGYLIRQLGGGIIKAVRGTWANAMHCAALSCCDGI